jgi:NADPH:quinone reductase-like Zn-dependent oxidoreductase
MLQENKYPVPVEDGGVSASDCAAEVIAIGSNVTKFTIGDRVAPTVDLMNLTGDERVMDSIALGGNGPGTLREYAIFEEKVLARLPSYLSWEEVSHSRDLLIMQVVDSFRHRVFRSRESRPGLP